MADEAQGVEVEVVPTEVSPTETPVHTEETQTAPQEAVDEMGVPIKNRVAEVQRKARRSVEAEQSILNPPNQTQVAGDQDEVLAALQMVARQTIEQELAPIRVRQFLQDNPGAADMIEDINRIRASHPEVAGVDKLDLAFKIAQAERQDEIVNREVQKRSEEATLTKANAAQSAVEGTGRSTAPTKSIDDMIKSAKTPADLAEIEKLLQR